MKKTYCETANEIHHQRSDGNVPPCKDLPNRKASTVRAHQIAQLLPINKILCMSALPPENHGLINSMKVTEILRAGKPYLRAAHFLSIELTKECPLRCPGCYAYGDDHLGGNVVLTQVSDFKGQQLVTRFMDLIDRHRPLHVSIVGGEPLVRFRELNEILPQLESRGVVIQLVTSAVRPIPIEWAKYKALTTVISIDGLAPEHDVRRTPATYERILPSPATR
jgi:sulfatase maturation enzyme AslB (radical SAM superfamily)